MSFSLQAEWYRISEGRDEGLDPVMASWNTIAECFCVRSGGNEGWPNGPAILRKALENLHKMPKRKAIEFEEAFQKFQESKNCPLPNECELTDSLRKLSLCVFCFYIAV